MKNNLNFYVSLIMFIYITFESESPNELVQPDFIYNRSQDIDQTVQFDTNIQDTVSRFQMQKNLTLVFYQSFKFFNKSLRYEDISILIAQFINFDQSWQKYYEELSLFQSEKYQREIDRNNFLKYLESKMIADGFKESSGEQDNVFDNQLSKQIIQFDGGGKSKEDDKDKKKDDDKDKKKDDLKDEDKKAQGDNSGSDEEKRYRELSKAKVRTIIKSINEVGLDDKQQDQNDGNNHREKELDWSEELDKENIDQKGKLIDNDHNHKSYLGKDLDNLINKLDLKDENNHGSYTKNERIDHLEDKQKLAQELQNSID